MDRKNKHYKYAPYKKLVDLAILNDVSGIQLLLENNDPMPPDLGPMSDSLARAFDYACLYGNEEAAIMLHQLRPDDYSGYAHLWFGTVHHIENKLCSRPEGIRLILANLPARYGTSRILEAKPAASLDNL